MDKKIISWPKCLNDSIDSYEFFFSVQKIINNSTTQYILLDMSKTREFATNLLSLIYLLIEENKEKMINVLLPNKQEYSGRKALLEAFDMYAGDTRSFFKPRVVVGNVNTREAEDVLLKYLRNIDLKNYGMVKTLLSELIANIKMHVKRVEDATRGYLAATYIEETNSIAISIVNSHRTILTTLKDKNYEFAGNEDAILWALRKSNSTRDDEESGGIGLYLLRKYISKLQGEVIIVSGDCFMCLDTLCYDKEDENRVIPKECIQLKNEFLGTIITLHIPYEIENKMEYKESDLLWLDITEV